MPGMTPRLATGIYVNALIRRVNQAGGIAMVLAKGDETSGALLLVTREKGSYSGVLERAFTASGHYEWMPVSTQNPPSEAEISQFCAKRRASDPDLWIVELDIADAARFAVEMDAAR